MGNPIILDNTLFTWASALTVAAALMFAAALLRHVVTRRLSRLAERTSTRVDDALVHAVVGTRLSLLFFVALHIATQPLVLAPWVVTALRTLAILALFVQIGIWASRALGFAIDRARERAMQTDASTATSLTAMNFIGRLLLWSILLLVALDNLGVDVTALVAGLGIGGIAIALAVQNILGDLFASLSILVDKPFVLGDFIVVDEFAGTVEHIGLKTTRIRSLGGEQLVFANGDLLSTRVRNYKRMRERRIVFEFGVLYRTPADTLQAIPGMVREIVCAQSNTRFDRAHFKGFGDSSLQFEVVYWMLVADYNAYMDTQQQVNLGLVRCFAEHGVEFAFPTRTVHLESPQPADAGD